MEFAPGTIVEGTVRSIANFGAFINLPEGKTGLVHISEVASVYVNDIRQHLSEGQAVKVKVLNVDDRGRLSLSIKQAVPAGERPQRAVQTPRSERPAQIPGSERPRASETIPVMGFRPQKAQPESFEDKLKQFMADSNSRISGVRQYEHRTRSRKR